MRYILFILCSAFAVSASAADSVVRPNPPVWCFAGDCAPAPTSSGDLTGKVVIVDSNSSCSSNCDGSTRARAFNNIVDLRNADLADGTDICLMSNSVFEDQRWSVPLAGRGSGMNISDEARVGTCYVDQGNNNALTWFDEGTRSGRGAKAEINGTMDAACISRQNCAVGTSDAVPGNINSALFEIRGDYVRVTDISLKDSAGRGFSSTAELGVVLERNQAHGVYGSNFVHLVTESQYFVIRENDFRRSGYRWRPGEYDFAERQANGGNCMRIGRGAHEDDGKAAYGIVEGNLIMDCRGEGLASWGISRTIFRGNEVYNTTNTGIYTDGGSHNVFEWNILAQLSDNCEIWDRNSQNCNRAMGFNAFSSEGYGTNGSDSRNANGNVVRNNVFAFGGGWSAGLSPESRDAGYVVGKYFFNNLIWYPDGNGFIEGVNADTPVEGGSEVVNNIMTKGSDGRHRCIGLSSFNNNAWDQSSGELDPDCHGSGDEFSARPQLEGVGTSPTRFSDRPTLRDYQVVAGTGVGTAADISSLPLWASCGDYPQLNNVQSVPLAPFKPICDQWRMKAYYENDGTPRGSLPNKGI